MPATLSGGERQRVALARALVRRRPVLLLDEPFAALGPAMRRDLVDLVVEKAAARGLVALLVSHDPEDALRAAPRTLYVEAGEVRAEGETARLLAGGVSPALDAYLGLRDPRA
jgi:thiamine transport system ATP-binding protein